MSNFSQGFNFGFSIGMFNGMFRNFGMFSPCCTNPFMGFSFCNPTPMFFMPSFNMHSFMPYYSPMPSMFNFGFNISNPSVFEMNNAFNQSFVPSNNSIYYGDIFTRDNSTAKSGVKGVNEGVNEGASSKVVANNIEVQEELEKDKNVGKASQNVEINKSKVNNSKKKTNAINTQVRALEDLKNKNWFDLNDEELIFVYGEYTRDITDLYKGSVDDLNKYLVGKGALEGKGDAFIKAQEKYGISASVLAAICLNETSEGTDYKAYEFCNVGGVRKYVGNNKYEWQKYSSIEECIDHMARFLKSGYVENKERSLTKLYQINSKYCPVSDPTDKANINRFWARNVDRFVKEIESLV